MAKSEQLIGTVDAGSHPVYEVMLIEESIHIRHVDDRAKCVQIIPSALPRLIETLESARRQTRGL